MKKKWFFIVLAVVLVCVFFHINKKPTPVQNYVGIVKDIENGNTLVLGSGLRVFLLGVEPGYTSSEMWLRNNVVGHRVTLVPDSRNEKSFSARDAVVKAYAIMDVNGEQLCVNRLVVNDNRDAYSTAYMSDSSFVEPISEPTVIKDKALYMQQRTLLVSVENDHIIGTAFFISEDGIALTNNHVLDGSRPACVYRYSDYADDSKIYEENKHNIKEIIWTNPDLDITIFSVELQQEEKVPYFSLIKQHEPKGHACHLFGNPQGYMASYSGGHIAAYQDDEEVLGRKLVQYELSTNGGNSGGPVMNDKGEVIAVHTKGQKRQQNGEVAQGLNFGVDILQVREILDRSDLNINYGGK